MRVLLLSGVGTAMLQLSGLSGLFCTRPPTGNFCATVAAALTSFEAIITTRGVHAKSSGFCINAPAKLLEGMADLLGCC